MARDLVSRTLIAPTYAGVRSYVGTRGFADPVPPTVPPPPVEPTLPSTPVVTTPVASDITETGAVVTWSADQPVQRWVEYGTTSGGPYPNETTHETDYQPAASQAMTGLSASTTYYGKAVATNSAGQVGRSAQFSFVTDTPPTTGDYPPDSTPVYIATPPTGLPGYLVQFTDPVWFTKGIRVSNVAGVMNAYPKRAAWNSDGTRLMLADIPTSGAPRYLLNGTTYAVIDSDFKSPGNATWSHTDPNLMYGSTNNVNTLRKHSAEPDAELAAEFTFTSYVHISLGNGEGSLSAAGDRVGLIGRRSNGTWWVITYDLVTHAIIGERQVGAEPNNCMISQNGLYLVVQYSVVGSGTSQGVWVYPASLATGSDIQLTSNVSHFDCGVNTAGQQVAVTNHENGRPAMWRLDTGARTFLFPTDPVAWRYGHTSCRSHARTGYALLSIYQNATLPTAPGQDQIAWVKLDGSGTVQVVCHAHHSSYGSTADNRMTRATPSPDGKKIVYNSEWLQGASAARYAFVAGMAV